ncbi:hypothetical protein T440DRAFT_469373 [Plenodomus tracheiphilus IPT5]|uniref:Mediator of RNA polymerase II transcription subunit 11 n=1 Tax=Plenodomus tracheiphilus IPT5 TaxID=1408161 RepID=A0A6A7B3M1_9PLEO|nr:hypothetical protein T440DRAFT_469373 [Plenodomus tracheiphilus IPT5]
MSDEPLAQPSPMDASTPPPIEPSTEAPQPETYRQAAASHIATLSEINHQLPKMLRYFATALTQLTDHPIHDGPSSPSSSSPTDTVESRREAFRKYATFTGMSVNLIREELVRQIEDLEKYKVIPASHPKFTVAKRYTDSTPAKEEPLDPRAGVKNGGYGEFDVGVLNARARAGMGGEDVLERVRGVLEELVRRREGVDESEIGDGGKDMVVDG